MLADAPMAMTAQRRLIRSSNEGPGDHISQGVGDLIRTTIGFDGLLKLSDDLPNMKAAQREACNSRPRPALDAGCDIAPQFPGDFST